ncbi:hypothetical protein SAMN06265355_12659, partial [Actinomadura mexicana]
SSSLCLVPVLALFASVRELHPLVSHLSLTQREAADRVFGDAVEDAELAMLFLLLGETLIPRGRGHDVSRPEDSSRTRAINSVSR